MKKGRVACTATKRAASAVVSPSGEFEKSTPTEAQTGRSDHEPVAAVLVAPAYLLRTF